jgi:DNA-binding NtrC family response regulator
MTEPTAVVEGLLVGESIAMQKLRALTVQASTAQLPVLIQGPTGVGKELVAKALHLASKRSGELIAFNVCAVADTVFEDTLFGHVKGAFTGAFRDAPGYMAEANGGSLFLDEINGLPLPAQAKLLRAVETGVFRPLGAQRDRMSDFRLIAATNDDLIAAVSAGSFRRDLLYRLSGLTIHVPPLTRRLDDIPVLIRHFVGKNPSLAGTRFQPEAMRRLTRHSWPGNVRELKHVVDRLSVLCGPRAVTSHDVSAAIGSDDLGLESVDSNRFARQRLIEQLERHEWDTARVAEECGVNRTTIYRRMTRLRITPPRFGDSCNGEASHASPSSRGMPML